MEQMEFITEHFGIKRYRSVAVVCAIYPDAHTVETHLYLKLASFCVHILIIVPFRVLILVKLTFRSSSYNLSKCLVRKIYHALAENMRNPASIQPRATIGLPVKRHSNGVSLAGR